MGFFTCNPPFHQRVARVTWRLTTLRVDMKNKIHVCQLVLALIVFFFFLDLPSGSELNVQWQVDWTAENPRTWCGQLHDVTLSKFYYAWHKGYIWELKIQEEKRKKNQSWQINTNHIKWATTSKIQGCLHLILLCSKGSFRETFKDWGIFQTYLTFKGNHT